MSETTTTQGTNPAPSDLPRLSRGSYWHKVARSYFGDDYWNNAHCPEAPATLSRGDLAGSILQGLLNRALGYICEKMVQLSIVICALLFIAFLGAWLYNAFTPALHAAIVAVTGLAATIKTAIVWLGWMGTVFLGWFVSIGILTVICLVRGGSSGPDDLLTEWSEFVVTSIASKAFRFCGWLGATLRSAGCATIGENLWNKLTTPFEVVAKKLDEHVIIE